MYPNEAPKKMKSSGSSKKRSKKNVWSSRERTSMSFLIVIAFFAIFGIIILTEVLMIDDRNSVTVRHVHINNRFSESVPDYEDVKDDYEDDSSIFVRENRFAASAFNSLFKKTRKLDPQDKLNSGIPVAPENDANSIAWGQMIPSKMEASLPPFPANTKAKDGQWQTVNGTRFKFFVFSAYYDRRDGRMLRIIGATKTRSPEKVFCRMWYPMDGNNTKFRSVSVMARVKVIRENWNLKYSACFILCPLRISYLEVPYSVSVVSKLRMPPGNNLLLRNTDTDPDFTNRSVENIPKNKIAICVKPLHFNYDQALYMLEFLELNNLLGVTHFTFYNNTIGPKVNCILQHYREGKIPNYFVVNSTSSRLGGDGNKNFTDERAAESVMIARDVNITVDILPWNLKMKSQKEIRTEGLFASLNDCLYRSMYRYSHVALIDLDEYIIPRHNDTIIELIEWLSKRINNKNTGAYSFQNAFFYLQFANDDKIYNVKNSPNPQLRAALVTQKKTRRRQKLHPQKQRSKYICKPEAVIEAGNHFIWEYCSGKGGINVPSNSAILHHYRVCEFGGNDCIKSPSVEDRTTHKYSTRLTDRVSSIYEALKDVCQLPEIPPMPTKPPKPREKQLKIKNNNSSDSEKTSQKSSIKIKKIRF